MTRDPQQPFCLFLCSNNAHPPCRNRDVSKVDQAALLLPPVLHDNPLTRDRCARYLAEVADPDREVGEMKAAAFLPFAPSVVQCVCATG